MPLAGLYWSTWCCCGKVRRLGAWAILTATLNQFSSVCHTRMPGPAAALAQAPSNSFLVFYGFLVVTVLKYAKFEAENAHNAFAMSWVPIICFLKGFYDLYRWNIICIGETCRNHVKAVAHKQIWNSKHQQFTRTISYSNMLPRLPLNGNEKQWAVDPRDRESLGKNGKKSGKCLDLDHFCIKRQIREAERAHTCPEASSAQMSTGCSPPAHLAVCSRQVLWWQASQGHSGSRQVMLIRSY